VRRVIRGNPNMALTEYDPFNNPVVAGDGQRRRVRPSPRR
jgi:hypothetical protein